MARPSNTLKRRSVQTGGLFSKFRRAIRSRTQKITNRNPLGYIARFKKAFPKGEITGTVYKYFIMGHEDTLADKLSKNEDIDNIGEDDMERILNKPQINNKQYIQKTELRKLWFSGKLGILVKDNKKYSVTYRSRYIDLSNEISNNATDSPVRILIYKPINAKTDEVSEHRSAKATEVVSAARNLKSSSIQRSNKSVSNSTHPTPIQSMDTPPNSESAKATIKEILSTRIITYANLYENMKNDNPIILPEHMKLIVYNKTEVNELSSLTNNPNSLIQIKYIPQNIENKSEYYLNSVIEKLYSLDFGLFKFMSIDEQTMQNIAIIVNITGYGDYEKNGVHILFYNKGETNGSKFHVDRYKINTETIKTIKSLIDNNLVSYIVSTSSSLSFN